MVNLEFGRMENLEYPTPMENLEEMTRSASLDGDAGDDVEWGTVLASVHLIKKYLTDLRGNGFGNPELVNGLLNNDSVSGERIYSEKSGSTNWLLRLFWWRGRGWWFERISFSCHVV